MSCARCEVHARAHKFSMYVCLSVYAVCIASVRCVRPRDANMMRMVQKVWIKTQTHPTRACLFYLTNEDEMAIITFAQPAGGQPTEF